MAWFEIQLTTATFLADQHNRLSGLRICPPEPLRIAGTDLQLHKVTFGPNSVRHDQPAQFTIEDNNGDQFTYRPPGFRTQLVQQANFHYSTVQEVLAHPDAAPVAVDVLPVTLVVTVSFFAEYGDCWFVTRLDRVEPAPAAPPGLLPALQAYLEPLIYRRAPFNVAGALGGGVPIRNAGITVDQAGALVTLRADRSGWSPAPWINFYRGAVEDHVGGTDWALFVDAGVLEGQFDLLVGKAAEDIADADVHVTSYGSDYTVQNGRAVVLSTIYATYDAITTDAFGKLEVAFEAQLRSELSMVRPGWLTIDVHLPDKNAIADGLLANLEFLSRLLPPAWWLLNAYIEDELGDKPQPTVPQFRQVGLRHYRGEVPLGRPAGQALHPTTLVAEPGGIAVRGDARFRQLTPAEPSTRGTPFGWRPPDTSCDRAGIATVAAFRTDPVRLARAHAEIVVDNDGTAPAFLCAVTPRTPEVQAAYGAGVRFRAEQLPTTIVVNIPNPAPASPPSLELIVRTTAGTRLVTLPPPVPLSREEADRLVARLLARVVGCKQLFEQGLRFDPRWLIDPPFDRPTDHVWEVAFQTLPPEVVITLEGADGPLVTGRPDRAGTLRLSAVRPPAAHGVELRVRQTGGPEAPAGSDTGLGLRQRLLTAASVVALPGPVLRMVRTPSAGRHALAVVSTDAVLRVDVTHPARPVVTRSWAVPGVRGVVDTPDGLLAHGSTRGLRLLGGEGGAGGSGTVDRPGLRCDDVLDVSGRHVLTGTELRSYTRGWCEAGRLPLAGGRALLRDGRYLLVAAADAVEVFDVATDTPTRASRTAVDGEIVEVHRAPQTDSAPIVVVLADGTARGYRVDRDTGGELVEAAHYPTRPWFADALPLGEVLVRADRAGGRLIIGTLGTPRPVTAVPDIDG